MKFIDTKKKERKAEMCFLIFGCNMTFYQAFWSKHLKKKLVKENLIKNINLIKTFFERLAVKRIQNFQF